MAETSTIMGLVGAFIAVAIMLGIGIQILGNVQTSTNCTSLPGGFVTLANIGSHKSNQTITDLQTASNATGWGLACFNNNTQIQNAYTLLEVVIIIIAAVVVLFVIRML